MKGTLITTFLHNHDSKKETKRRKEEEEETKTKRQMDMKNMEANRCEIISDSIFSCGILNSLVAWDHYRRTDKEKETPMVQRLKIDYEEIKLQIEEVEVEDNVKMNFKTSVDRLVYLFTKVLFYIVLPDSNIAYKYQSRGKVASLGQGERREFRKVGPYSFAEIYTLKLQEGRELSPDPADRFERNQYRENQSITEAIHNMLLTVFDSITADGGSGIGKAGKGQYKSFEPITYYKRSELQNGIVVTYTKEL